MFSYLNLTINESIFDTDEETNIGYMDNVINRHWFNLIFIFVIFITISANLMVVALVLKNKMLQNTTNYFLVSLSCTDFLIGLLVMPIGLSADTIGYFPLGHVMCNIWILCDIFFCTCSIWHLAIISVDRLLTIKYPLKYGLNKKMKRVVLKICTVWIVSFIICLPLFGITIIDPGNFYNPKNKSCQMTNTEFKVFGSLLAFYVPFVIIAVTYTITMKALKQVLKSKIFSVANHATVRQPLPRRPTAFIPKNRITDDRVSQSSIEETPIKRHLNSYKKLKARYSLESKTNTNYERSQLVRPNSINAILPYYNNNKINQIEPNAKFYYLNTHCKNFTIYLKFEFELASKFISNINKDTNRLHIDQDLIDLLQKSLKTFTILINLNENSYAVKSNNKAVTASDSKTKTILVSKPKAFKSNSFTNVEECKKINRLTFPTNQLLSPPCFIRPSILKKANQTSQSECRKSSVSICRNVIIRHSSSSAFSLRNESSIFGDSSSSKPKLTDYFKRIENLSTRTNKSAANERKALRVLMIVFVVFVVLWSPFFLVNILSALCSVSCIYIDSNVITTASWLGYMSSMTNPLISTIFSENFRKAFVEIFRQTNNKIQLRPVYL